MNGGADENTVISCNHAVCSGHDVILVHGAQTRPEILATVDARVKIVELPSLVQPIAPLSDMRALRRPGANLPPSQARRRPHPYQQGRHPRASGCAGRERARRRSRRAHRALRQRRPTRDVRVPDGGGAVQGMTHAFIDVSPAMRDLCVKAGVGAPERHHVVSSRASSVSFSRCEASRRLARSAPARAR